MHLTPAATAIEPMGAAGNGERSEAGDSVAKFLHCVHTAHAEAGILTQEYLSPVW